LGIEPKPRRLRPLDDVFRTPANAVADIRAMHPPAYAIVDHGNACPATRRRLSPCSHAGETTARWLAPMLRVSNRQAIDREQ